MTVASGIPAAVWCRCDCVKNNNAVVGVFVAAAELSPARESLPERGRGLIQGRDFEEGGWAGVQRAPIKLWIEYHHTTQRYAGVPAGRPGGLSFSLFVWPSGLHL